MRPEPFSYFRELGDRIEKQWLARGYDEEIFPHLAQEALAAACPHLEIGAADIVDAIFQPSQPFLQPNGSELFGEPPVTLYQAPRFYIEALFWFSSTTAIHEHSFSGAFAVLAGSSVHSHWRFTQQGCVNSRMLHGRLEPEKTEILRPGDLHQIQSGDRLIHQLFHLEVPSVTIVVRTYLDRHQLPQYRYQLPGLALDATDRDPNRTRRLMFLDAMARGQLAGLEEHARRLIERSDVESLYYLFSNLTRRKVDPEILAGLYAAARERHGELIDLFRAACAWESRERVVVGLRAKVSDPNLRLLLALLMLMPNRDAVCSAVGELYPGAEPLATIEGWLEGTGKDTIGFAFDATNRILFRGLVEGRGTEELLELLAAQLDGQSVREHRDQLVEHAKKMARSVLFLPLLSESPLRQAS